MNANLNDIVRFKLTAKGRDHVAELNRTHPVYSQAPHTLGESEALRRAIALRRDHLVKLALANAAILAARAANASK